MAAGSSRSCCDDAILSIVPWQQTICHWLLYCPPFWFQVQWDISTCFWLQYHSKTNLSGLCSLSSTHLIRPSDTSKAYAKRHKLLPLHCFLNLTHTDTYIHCPFDFTTVNGWKSLDQICQSNWDILWSQTKMFVSRPTSTFCSSILLGSRGLLQPHNISQSAFFAQCLLPPTAWGDHFWCAALPLTKGLGEFHCQPLFFSFSFWLPSGCDGFPVAIDRRR